MPLYELHDNRISPLSATTFGEEGIGERKDLQRLLRDQKDFVVADRGKRLFELELRQPGIKEHAEDPEKAEWAVGVRWHATVPLNEAKTLLRHPPTLRFLQQGFRVEEE